MSLQIEKEFSLCGLSIRPAVITLTVIQIFLSITLGTSYRILLDGTTMISIVFCIHVFCAVLALVFLAFICTGKKLGSFYEVILHAHLLGILLIGLTSLFCLMYLPLSFVQASHSLSEGMHWLGLSCAAAAMFCLQFLQKSANEEMLTHIEHSFT